jgi:hypothetical protein
VTTRQPAVPPSPGLPAQRNETSQIEQRNQTDQTNQIDQRNERNQRNQIDQIAAARIERPPALIATEEEVRQFFAKYTERYGKKDLEGFLALFSPRAVHNRQDGLEGIRKIYGNFFNQSQEVKYYLSDLRIEIYQNAVEAKAHYELIQLLKKNGERRVWRGEIRWTLVREGGALKILSLAYQPQKSNQ